ncbi:MAG: hypothetical protein JWN33_154 [Candidatus Saccharibacteria bacterium]|nr:hypothetical protein [Candidatus Saccharibacteria bacterium]
MKTMKATKLRATLVILLLLIFSVAGAGFYFVYQWLDSYALAVSKIEQDAKASATNLQTLRQLGGTLAEQQDIIAASSSVFASTDYRAQLTPVLTQYANKAGLKVTYSYEATPAASATPATPGATPATPQELQPAAPTNIIIVTFTNPVPYKKLVAFIADIESTLPRMQLTGLKITAVDDPSTGAATVDPITLQVYPR